MTEAKQTKCPHCGSTFRISDAQMAAKGGNVRCGSCLQVFRADLYLVGATPPRPAAPAAVAAAPKPKAKTSPDDESWALELLGEDVPEEAHKPVSRFEVEELQAPRRREQVLHTDEDAMAHGNRAVPRFQDDDEIDLEPDFVAESPTASRSPRLRFDDELSDMLDDAGAGLSHDEAEQQHRLSTSADESWAQGILSELEQEEKKQKKYGMELIDNEPKKAPPRNLKLAAATGQKIDEELLAAAGLSEPPARPAARSQAPATAPAPVRQAPKDDVLSFDDDDDALNFLNDDIALNPQRGGNPNPFALAQPLAHVDAPLVLKPQRTPIDWARLLTWTVLCLVAIGMFVAQYVYFNFEQLSADARYRPTIEQLCAKYGCYVPEVPDASKLRIDNLVVRTHPSVDGALQVDAIVQNAAPFAQPFPALRLTFVDRNEQLVAARILQPREYLQGDAAKMRRMPPETPVRISVNLVNPGGEAVSYTMEPLL